MIHLGVRAHDFGKLPIDQLAATIAAKGFTSVQLALAKAIEGLNSETGGLSPGLARHVRHAFERQGVAIAVLGCYFNPIDPDKDRRAQHMARFKEHLRFARDFGCSVVATETGSRNADWSFHPDNASEAALADLTDHIGELVQEAEKFGVFVCIEAVTRHVVSTPQRMRRVLDTINSPNLQVLFDWVNLLSIENYRDQAQVIDESFALFGDRIQVIHAKDYAVENNELKPVPIGEGQIEFQRLFHHLNSKKHYIDVLLEETTPSTVDESVGHLQALSRV